MRKHKDRRREYDSKEPGLYLENGFYYWRGTPIPGQGEKTWSLRVNSRGLAIQALKNKRLELFGVKNKKGSVLVCEVADSILRDYDHKIEIADERFKRKILRTKLTVAEYFENHLIPYFGEMAVENITKEVWQEYQIYAQKESEQRRGKKRKLLYDRRYLMQILREARRIGKLTTEIPKFEIPSGEKKRSQTGFETYTDEEIKLLYEAAEGAMKGLVIGGYKMGLRPIEVFGTKWSQVDFKKNLYEITEEQAKRNAEKSAARTIHMNPTYAEYLKDLFNNRRYPDSPWVYPTRENAKEPIRDHHHQWARLQARVGVRHRVAYCLRHTAITEAVKRMAKSQVSIVEMARYFGTSVEEMDRTYIRLKPEDTRRVSTILESGAF